MVLLESLAVSYIGSELLTDSTKTIYQKIANIISFTTPDIEHIYDELDIKSSLRIISQTIQDFENNISAGDEPEKSIVIVFNEIHLIIDKIDETMKDIDRQVKVHNNKWFSKWRTPEYIENIEKIKLLDSHLQKRFDSFCKINRMFM